MHLLKEAYKIPGPDLCPHAASNKILAKGPAPQSTIPAVRPARSTRTDRAVLASQLPSPMHCWRSVVAHSTQPTCITPLQASSSRLSNLQPSAPHPAYTPTCSPCPPHLPFHTGPPAPHLSTPPASTLCITPSDIPPATYWTFLPSPTVLRQPLSACTQRTQRHRGPALTQCQTCPTQPR